MYLNEGSDEIRRNAKRMLFMLMKAVTRAELERGAKRALSEEQFARFKVSLGLRWLFPT